MSLNDRCGEAAEILAHGGVLPAAAREALVEQLREGKDTGRIPRDLVYAILNDPANAPLRAQTWDGEWHGQAGLLCMFHDEGIPDAPCICAGEKSYGSHPITDGHVVEVKPSTGEVEVTPVELGPRIPAPRVSTIAVMVTVDTDELREWADRHADAGQHGVAHVLYKAAADGESLSDQALAAARAGALREAADQLEYDGMKRLGAHTVIQWLRVRARIAEGKA